MKTKLTFLILLFCFACTNENKPLTEAEKDKIIGETKELVSAIFLACENCEPEKLTVNFLDTPDFISLVNGEYAGYQETVRKYPVLMSEFKLQKATITSEKYAVLDGSTVLYSSKSNWKCTLKNDSIALYNNCTLQLLLKKTSNQWKVLSWAESYAL